MYKLTNSEGRANGYWSETYKTRAGAEVALRIAMGWDDIVLSESYATGDDGNETGWSAYATQEACDADQEGAFAPRIETVALVTVECMEDCWRDAHRQAGNWGVYPDNGASRVRVTRAEAVEIVANDPDGYSHILESR